MPLRLDNNDIAIIKSLTNDGRKSFRQISRETGITTPMVKARFERLSIQILLEFFQYLT
jgi:Lrp/AsnC family leucine-responsive transcriptional regulator